MSPFVLRRCSSSPCTAKTWQVLLSDKNFVAALVGLMYEETLRPRTQELHMLARWANLIRYHLELSLPSAAGHDRSLFDLIRKQLAGGIWHSTLIAGNQYLSQIVCRGGYSYE